MFKFKKIIALFMAVAFIAGITGCVTGEINNTSTSTASSETTYPTVTTITSGNETTSETTSSTSDTTEITPISDEDTILSDTVGEYVTLKYNPMYCKITTAVKKGVGSSETVTLTVEMKKSYIFNGWSQGDAISNGSPVKSTGNTYTFDTNSPVTVYANYSMSILYQTNGGTDNTGTNTYTATFPVTFYKNPSTLTERGYFIRSGYTLTEYNTKADGTGTPVSLGSRAFANGESEIELFCIWEKQNDASDFEYTVVSETKITITKYIGDSDSVVIPDKIDGKYVTKIAEGAFSESDIVRVVLPKTLITIENGAFDSCLSLQTVVMFDSVKQVYDSGYKSGNITKGSFYNCPDFSKLLVNAISDKINFWTNISNVKLDRLMWAKDKKKIIIVGGSGSLLGYDCEMLDEEYGGEYEIINFGTNAQYSASFCFEIISNFITEGDIVLWAPESGSYMLGATNFHRRLWEIASENYDALRYIDISGYSSVFTSYMDYVTEKTSAGTISFEYFNKNSNEYGDDISARLHLSTSSGYNFTNQGNFSPAGCTYLNDIIGKISEKGGKAYFSFAAMDAQGMEAAGQTDEDLAWYLGEILSYFDVTVISEYEDYVFDTMYFWNSEWHLTNEGASLRTQQIIQDINSQLAKE